MLKRTAVFLCLIISLFFLPVYFVFFLAFLAMTRFRYFFEGLLPFLLSDVLYGAGSSRVFGINFGTFVLAFFILLAIEFTKSKMRNRV